MKNGLYKAEFSTPLGAGFGVVHAQDGRIWGGDSAMYYIGSYTLQDEMLSSKLSIAHHSRVPGVTSVLGADEAELELHGKVSGDIISTTGNSPQAPGVSFKATLTLISE
ncbi:UNVERIFIED_ORG: type III secretion system (T3SS) negative regulator GrlR [Martelella mediterranea]